MNAYVPADLGVWNFFADGTHETEVLECVNRN
jgi:hypothetical protein